MAYFQEHIDPTYPNIFSVLGQSGKDSTWSQQLVQWHEPRNCYFSCTPRLFLCMLNEFVNHVVCWVEIVWQLAEAVVTVRLKDCSSQIVSSTMQAK